MDSDYNIIVSYIDMIDEQGMDDDELLEMTLKAMAASEDLINEEMASVA
ncbi:hypothetical protein [Butyrivibrio sp. AE2032]|nr:hypothetical protein [Butyrivibrio sp. AE2032]